MDGVGGGGGQTSYRDVHLTICGGHVWPSRSYVPPEAQPPP
jgi:hypothetical protein